MTSLQSNFEYNKSGVNNIKITPKQVFNTFIFFLGQRSKRQKPNQLQENITRLKQCKPCRIRSMENWRLPILQNFAPNTIHKSISTTSNMRISNNSQCVATFLSLHNEETNFKNINNNIIQQTDYLQTIRLN